FTKSDLSRPPATLSRPGEGRGEVEEVSRVTEVASAYHVYQRLLLQNGALDFGDLINYCLELFRKRPKILELFRKKFEYILIDEFQDTNYAQYELVRLLAAPQNNLTLVGDDDQSIFKFRGASISNILHFKKDYPDAKFISLTQNYRSGQKILDMAYKFIKQNDPDRLEVKLGIDKKLKGVAGEAARIEHFSYPDYLSEAGAVIEKILEIKDKSDLSSNSSPSPGEEGKVTWNDFAILARSHETLVPFIAKLEERGIPYIYFANRGLYRKSIILDLIFYLKILENYHESHALYRVLNMPVFGISHDAVVELTHLAKKKSLSLYEAIKGSGGEGRAGIKRLLTLLDKHAKLAREKNMAELYVQIITDLQFGKRIQSETQAVEDAKYLESFSRKIQNFQSDSPDKSLKTFMQGLDFELEAGSQGELEFDPEAGPEAVKIVTVHGAKGLEFTHVFVVGLVDKRFPSVERRESIEIPLPLIKDILPEGDIHLEEERRLFYVAMTRAKAGLHLTRALDYGGKLTKKPSRFLIELGMASEEKKSKPTGKVSLAHAFAKVSAGGQVLPIPKYFSFSQISQFKSCPLGYKYRYILGLPTKGSAALSFGSTIHKTFEKFLKPLRQASEAVDLFGQKPSAHVPKFELLERAYQESWLDDWYDGKSHMEEYRQHGSKILKIFYEEISQDFPKPKYLEANFRMRLPNGYFIGKIDRADETPEGLLIIDYKTGSPRGINKVDKEQLLIYQWAAQEFLHEKVADLQYWFLRDKLVKESFKGTDADIADLKKNLTQTVAEIIEATKSNSFYKLDLQISHKDGCDYRDLEV
ncbi:MAG: ATP-dependent DNA helicase, partial [bacterium]|nr:ATP-dependent DNA helicase [bacterium]